MDNQILVFSADERARLFRKKRFVGHNSAGYACQVNFSPDGKYVFVYEGVRTCIRLTQITFFVHHRYLLSGDANGGLLVYDWASQKVKKRFRAHDKPTIGVEWHPQEASMVASCSWDDTIKLWV